MGIFGALNTAVSGLRAQSFALENISGNIANSQTTAFKRQETSFQELVSDAGATQRNQASGSVDYRSRPTTTLQGDIQASDIDTHIAVNGDGYFIVEKPTGVIDNTTIFSGSDLYTRAGDFSLTREGYFSNSAGYFLKGFSIDPATGNRTGSVPSVLRVSADFLPAEQTDLIEYRANLPAYPLTSRAQSTVPDSELLDASLKAGAAPFTGNATISATEENTFIETSISGGAITVYNSLGEAVDVQIRWAKTASANTSASDNWNAYYLSDSNATGATAKWTKIAQDYTFDSAGNLAPSVPSLVIPALTVDGRAVGNVTLQHGTGGVTQYADSKGVTSVGTISQNGAPAGDFVSAAVETGGRVRATYSNGETRDLFEIGLVSFNSDDGLRRIDGGGAYEATNESGAPIAGATGTVLGSALEASNTDIADEFTKLIVTQQAYTANSRIVTTGDEMMSEVLNIIR